MLNIKKTLLAGSFAAALLLIPTYASANSNQNNNPYTPKQETRIMSNAEHPVANSGLVFGTEQDNNSMQIGSKRGRRHHIHRVRTYKNTAKSRRFAHMYLVGNGDGSSAQDMKASRLANHDRYFRKEFKRYAPKYYNNQDSASRNIKKQVRVGWRLLKGYSKRSKTYHLGWYSENAEPIHRLRHNHIYRSGFRDSIFYKFGLRAPVREYFKEFMQTGTVRD